MGSWKAPAAVVVVAGAAFALWQWAAGPPRPPMAREAARSAAVRPVPPPRPILGAGSCTSSGCHAAAVDGHPAWQSAYTVWSTRDPHARAHRVLREPLAQRIVAALAVRDPGSPVSPAWEHVACIGCHATGRGSLAAEGVSCESCHGAAGDWLVPHALPGWRTAGNTLGMDDLTDPFACASRCAECHVGGGRAVDGAPREVSHDLIAAGHPRLAFELRSFKRAEPPHWHDRFAEAEAVGEAIDPLEEWAMGRLGALHAFLEQIRLQAVPAGAAAAATAAVWPEFAAFDCYGCHRPAIPSFDRPSMAKRAGAGRPLGVPRLEPLHWALVDAILPPESAASLLSVRADIERSWWRRPAADAVQAGATAVAAATSHLHATWANQSAGAVAAAFVVGVDPADWDEAAAVLAALEAIVDRSVWRGAEPAAVETARRRLEDLRGLLEFTVEGSGDVAIRFDSPRGHDPARVAVALAAAVAALQALP